MPTRLARVTMARRKAEVIDGHVAWRQFREVAFAAFDEQRLTEQYSLAAVILGDLTEAQDATHDAFEVA